ncbi:MAG: PhoX family phosphatase, partial [Acinetobacter sp.]
MTDFTPHHEDNVYDSNDSGNTEFKDLFNKNITRRDLITKSAGGAVALTLAATLTGCNDDDNSNLNNGSNPTTPVEEAKTPTSLSFKTVDKNTLNAFTVPEGYQARVLYALGDPITDGLPEWSDNNIPAGPTFSMRSGDNHDGMTFFGMNKSKGNYDAKASNEGLLVLNHEYINQGYLHSAINTIKDAVRAEDEVIREVNSHGVSIIHVVKDPITQEVKIDKTSLFNRRITAASKIEFSGPAKGHELLKSKLSPEGLFTLGTHNNCGNGYTPWGTYLTTEENFDGYLARNANDDRDPQTEYALTRYKIKKGQSSQYKWNTPQANLLTQDMYERWNSSISAATAAQDFRYSANSFGWIVEIDPFDGRQLPVKRTALGRFAHEDCRASRAIEGQQLAFYMGDDSTGEYIYKYVSNAKWDTKDINGGYTAGDKYLNSGKLYVAKFDFNEATQKATGEWIELNISDARIASYANYKFADQGDVLINARLAADAVGATKMDRPEWCAVNPKNGEVYITLTNNSNRGKTYATDAANPRNYFDNDSGSTSLKGNINGHIIRLREHNDQTSAINFVWDIFLFGAEADSLENVNLSGLTDANDFSSPDGMWFDPRGVLWVQTDDSSYTDETNCMMLAALPGQIGDGQVTTALSGTATQQTPAGAVLNDTKLRRFLTGPSGCEITGVTMTPDYKAIFVNVQHPGGVWPSNHPSNLNSSKGIGTRPRSATVVITRIDGKEIAGESLEKVETPKT